MADYIQHGGLPPTTPNPQFFLLGFRLNFLPIFSGLHIYPSTFWAINCTENHLLIDFYVDGTPPIEKTLNFLISAFDYISWVFMQDGGL